MRASRLVSILLLLQSRGRMSAQALADEFEVSVRTIYRDIDSLSAAGVPVYGDSGPGGGFALLEGYRSGLSGLTALEAQAVLLGGFPQAIAVAGLNDAARSGRRKLLAASPRSQDAETFAARVHLDPVGWYRRTAATPFLPTVATALFKGRRLAMRYESWNGEVERCIDPEGIVLKSGTWYLVACVERRPRIYRVASIRSAEILAETAQRLAEFVLTDYWAEACEAFERSLHRADATICIGPAALGEIDRLGHRAASAILSTPPGADGWRTATVPIEGIDHAATLLLGLGPHCRVVSPPALRAKLLDLARGIAQMND